MWWAQQALLGNWKWAKLSFIYLLLLFWGDSLVREPGFFQVLAHIFCLFFFSPPLFFLRVSFSEEPGYLTPTVSGECLSPTGSSESPHPQKREDASLRGAGCPGWRWAALPARSGTLPTPRAARLPDGPPAQQDGASGHPSSSGAAGGGGCWEPLCSSVAVTINAWYPAYKNYQLPPLPCPKEIKELSVIFFQAAFYILKEVLWWQCNPPMALARDVPADLTGTLPAVQASPREQSSWGQLAVAICYVAAKSVSTAAAGWALPRSRFFQRTKIQFIW